MDGAEHRQGAAGEDVGTDGGKRAQGLGHEAARAERTVLGRDRDTAAKRAELVDVERIAAVAAA